MNMEELLASYDSYISRFKGEEEKERLKLFSFAPTKEEAVEMLLIKGLDDVNYIKLK